MKERYKYCYYKRTRI